MPVSSVNCNLCGASLEIPLTTNFATCGNCGARLAIKRTATSIFTESAGDEPAGRLADQLNELALQNELNRIDLEWQNEREAFLIGNPFGAKNVPRKDGARLGIVFAVVVGIGFIIFTASLPRARAIGAPIWAGGIVLLVGLGSAIQAYSKAAAYERAEAQYRRRREAVTAKHPGQSSMT
jgi:hypothetical protein